MVKYKQGDLIQAAREGGVEVIAHCCNIYNTMGAGVALAIANAFPEAKEIDGATHSGDAAKLGTYTKTYNIGGLPGNATPTVYNLYGQAGYGGRARQVQYGYLFKALVAMAKDIRAANKIRVYQGMKPEKIGIPKLGCGLAGGNWEIVEEILNNVCGDLDITVYCMDN